MKVHPDCDACSEVKCSICGHEPCPVCLDCCDHTDCIAWDAKGSGIKKHKCDFVPCAEHASPPGP